MGRHGRRRLSTPLNERLGVDEGETSRCSGTLDAATGVGRDQSGRRSRSQPFLGVIGMPPDEPASTRPRPRACGGNIDCKELVAGTTLFLPIPSTARSSRRATGTPRRGTARCRSSRSRRRSSGRAHALGARRPRLEWPIAWTPDAWLTFGFDEDLDEAAAIAIEGMLDLMEREHGLERREALALASVVVDLRVTQLVNGSRGIHARLAHDALR